MVVRKFLGASFTNSYIFLAVSIIAIILIILVRVYTKKFKRYRNYGWNFSLYCSIFFALILGLVFASLSNFSGLNVTDQIVNGTPTGQKIYVYDYNWEIYNISRVYANIFVSSISLIIAPLIFFNLGSKIAAMKNAKTFWYSVGYLLLGVTFAIGLALGFSQLFKILPSLQGGVGSNDKVLSPGYESIFVTIVSWIPRNILASDAFQFATIGVLVTSMIIGFTLWYLRKHYSKDKQINQVVNFLGGGEKVFNTITMFVLELLPLGLFGLFIRAIMQNGVETFITVSWFVLIFMSALFILVISQLLYIWFVTKINPVSYAKKAYKPWLSAFLTSSSNSTVPLTIESLRDKFKVSSEIASSVPALGTTIGMVACGALYPGLAAGFVAIAENIFSNGTASESNFWIFLIFGIFFSSFGLSGAPGVASVSTRAVFATVNLNYGNTMGALLAIDPLIDMFRTWANVNGVIVAALLADRKGKKLANAAITKKATKKKWVIKKQFGQKQVDYAPPILNENK